MTEMEPVSGEPTSLEHILASELYPKKALVSDDASLQPPYPPVPGESIEFLGRTADGVIALSNFRLFIRHGPSVMNIPLALVDTIECRDIFFLYVYCKDARSLRCVFSTNEACMEWYKRLSNALNPPAKLQDVFAFAFNAWCVDECGAAPSPDLDAAYQLCQSPETGGYSFGREVDRLGFDLKKSWRICYVNEDFNVSGTYPKLHIVPASISDKDIESVASFRSSRRFPSVVWRDVRSGAVIARSSQPEVGWLGWRSSPDECLLQSISQACVISSPQQKLSNGHTVMNGDISAGEESVKEVVDEGRKMLIIDARSYAAAVANRAKGGGCECPEYYQNCEILFMSLANIHSIRKSFQALRALCAAQPDQASWLSMLENTKWLSHISGLMRAAMIVVNAIDKEGRPVLVHCSDGWDRTPQIVALAEIMLDPYYRTIEGFQVLVEREWLAFGHKFADRCALGIYTDDTNERCPIFLQFLDCMHQLVKQFPCAFQFNEAFLVKLVQHTYSCLFGNFLCNSSSERHLEKVHQQTSSVWTLLRPSNVKFRNYLYTPNTHQVLRPSNSLRHLHFWSAVYLSEDSPSGMGASLDDSSETTTPDDTLEDKPSEQTLLPKTRSCDDIVAAVEASTAPPSVTRRLSDPNISTDPNCLLKQEAIKGSEFKEPAGDTRLKIDQDVVKFTNIESTENVDQLIQTEDFLEENNERETEEDKETSKDVSKEDKLNEKHKETVILETSTDTLTGDLADGTALSRNTSQTSLDSKSIQAPNQEGSAQERKSEGTISEEMQMLSLERSSSISTSTSEISDSHISLRQRHLMGASGNTRDAQGLSLLIPDLATMAAGAAAAGAASAAPQTLQKILENAANTSSSHTSSASGESETYTPPTMHSRTPSSTSPPTPGMEKSCWQFGWRQTGGYTQTLDVDGLTTWVEAGQARLCQMEAEYQARIEQLQRQLHMTKLALVHYTTATGNGTTSHLIDSKDENSSQAESQESMEQTSLPGSDVSWEQVEEREARMTLWVPDHAVTHCAGCDQEFWIVRRKHHCRSCGRVYCGECTNFTIPLPQQQLNIPVRVCKQCYWTIKADSPALFAKETAINYAALCNGIHGNSFHSNGLSSFTVLSNGSSPDSDTDKTTTPTCS